jgi:3-oxoacyl-[acyl-carrier-protein] synthase-3
MEKLVETTDEWIVTRTGIRERHFAAEDEFTSDMATKAAQRALENANLKATDLDLIIIATISTDMPTPSTACFVQAKLGAFQAAAFDISAACAGFVYGFSIARAFVESGLHKNVLLIGAEKLTTFIDWKDRGTCVLFGDGAGAVVIGPVAEGKHEIISTYMAANGADTDLLKIPGGGCRFPSSLESVENHLHSLKMNGKQIFKIGVTVMSDALLEAAKRANITMDQIALVIPHQANNRIIQAIGERLGVPSEKLFVNVDKIGNTSAASVGIALDDAARAGKIKEGDYVAFVAFGAGTTLASSIVKW